ncbi:MAG: type I methionyl aminopeptidase [bacterium]
MYETRHPIVLWFLFLPARRVFGCHQSEWFFGSSEILTAPSLPKGGLRGGRSGFQQFRLLKGDFFVKIIKYMIRLKTPEQIKILAEGGNILSEILAELAKAVKSGVVTLDLEKMARRLIKEAGGEASFLNYKPHGGRPYPAALCTSINEAVVHTPATLWQEILPGDIVSLDLGLWYKGLCTDAATTVMVLPVDKKAIELAAVTKKSLEAAIKECEAGAPISAIGKKIQGLVEAAGFSVIRDLVGHGVGLDVHEDPMVPNYYDQAYDKIILKEGMVIAIEPMTALGGAKIELDDDGFTYRTKDLSVAAHFEATVAITKNGPLILTPII